MQLDPAQSAESKGLPAEGPHPSRSGLYSGAGACCGSATSCG